jgi:hypothetical protein
MTKNCFLSDCWDLQGRLQGHHTFRHQLFHLFFQKQSSTDVFFNPKNAI